MHLNQFTRIIPTSILVLIYFLTFSQTQPLKFITYTTNDGLLHNYTKKCIEDKKGFIWIVTEIGVSRFDGVYFKNFQHDDHDTTSLPHNTIHDITVDDVGSIWLATDKGLCFYSYSIQGFTSIDISGTFKNSPRILALTYDKVNNSIWFITDKALFEWNINTSKIIETSCSNDSPTQINQLYLSSDHRLWIAGYRDGFFIYDITHDKTTHHLPLNWVTTFSEDKNKIMWIGHWHTDHLGAWNMVTGEYTNWLMKDESGGNKYIIISGMTSSPFHDDSLLFLSTQTMGIRVFNTHLNKFTGGYSRDIFVKYSIPVDFTNYIYTDSRGIIWLCTWNGFCKMNMQEQQFRTIEIPFLNTPLFQYYNLIEGIVPSEDPNEWWLGINGCGLAKYNVVTKQKTKELLSDIEHQGINIPAGAWTEFVINTKDHIIWAGNDVGIARIEGDKVLQYDISINNYHPWRKTISIGQDHTFWIGTEMHIVHFDPLDGKYQAFSIDSSLHEPLPRSTVIESGFCDDGHLWIGTQKGLFRFDINTHVSQKISFDIPGSDSIDINTINSLITDGKEMIYLGTSGGLGIYNIRTHQLAIKGVNENVKPILWKSMLRDNAGNIWIYTTHSLFRYDPVKDEFIRFTTADGIHNFSSDGTHLFSFNDNFYIGYRGAYTEFDPLQVDINKTMVKPLITDLFIGNTQQRIDMDSFSNHVLSLSAGKKEITFDFTGIDYTNSEKITFIYRLDTDTDWHETGTNRLVTYTNLSPGHYTFQLKARNSSGIVNEEAAIFQFYIAHTLLQQWWFWPLLGFVFVSTVIALANKRVRKIRKEEALKTKTKTMLAELETKLLRSQMNPHFIFNSLNSIQKYIWENKEEDAAEYLARFAKLIRAILENSRKEFITLQEELDVMKLYIELEHRRSNGKFDYHIQVDTNLETEKLMIPPLLLQPYIENAIWHGVNKKNAHGHIDVNVRKKDEMLEFTVDDDGVGRTFNQPKSGDVNVEKTSLGTDITMQRISHLAIGANLAGVRFIDKMQEGVPSGTTVIVTIPINTKAHA